MKRKMIMVLCVFLLCCNSLAMAEGGREEFRGQKGLAVMKLMKFVEDLGVTQEQRVAIRDVFKQHRGELKEKRKAVFTAREQLFSLIHQDNLDEMSVRAAYQNVAVQEEELVVARAKTVSEIRALLTPEQKKALLNKKTEIFDRIHKFQEKF